MFTLKNGILVTEKQVVMATFNYGYPLRKIIEEKGIKVVLLNENTLNNMEFDIIWAQHFTTLNYSITSSNSFADLIFLIHLPLFRRIRHQKAFTTWSLFKKK